MIIKKNVKENDLLQAASKAFEWFFLLFTIK